MSKIVFFAVQILLFSAIFTKPAYAVTQTFHEPNPVFVNSGKVFVYVISDQTFSDVPYSFRAWKVGENPTACQLFASTNGASLGSGRLEKVRRADGTLYQLIASWDILGCRAREGIWNFELWVGAGNQDRNDSSLIVRDYTFEMQQAGGETPVIAPEKPAYGLSEDPYVKLSNARAGNTYTFFWEALPTQREIAAKSTPATSDPQSVKLSRAGIQSGPGDRTLCMAIGNYVTALFLKCTYRAVFRFTTTIPPPTGAVCKIDPTGADHPNETDDISLSATGVTPFNSYKAYLNTDHKGTQYTQRDTVGPILLDKKLPQNTYTAVLYKEADNSLVCSETFTVGPKASPSPVPIGPPAEAGGIPCGDADNPGFQTAIGCIHTKPAELVKDFLKFGLGIAGGLAFLMMLLGAFQMLTSAGNPDTLNAGRERLTNAVIGLLFVIFAVLLLQIIGVGILDIPGFKP